MGRQAVGIKKDIRGRTERGGSKGAGLDGPASRGVSPSRDVPHGCHRTNDGPPLQGGGASI
jgi:hypothetical protein